MDTTLVLIVKATVNTDELDSFNAYIHQLGELYKNAHVAHLGQYIVHETFVGTESPSFIALFKFPDRAAFEAVYESAGYKQTMLPLREKGFKKLEVYISNAASPRS